MRSSNCLTTAFAASLHTAFVSSSAFAFIPRFASRHCHHNCRRFCFGRNNTRKSSLFESMRTGYYKDTNSDEISLEILLQKAASVGEGSSIDQLLEKLLEKLLENKEGLFFSSSYTAGNHERGFSNWIVPGRIMVGQYPGGVPENTTPAQEETQAHLQKVLACSKKVCFVSLQSELPPQDDRDSWNQQNGKIYLEDAESRKEWPNPFVHYAPIVDSILEESSPTTCSSVKYIHHPIQDLSVPSNSKNLRLLLWKILDFLESGSENSMVYIHCWGGRGRAGLTACCLLVLLSAANNNNNNNTDNNVTLQSIFDLVQTGYESRLGSEHMPVALSRSPQTESQRRFVLQFYQEVTDSVSQQRQR